MAEYTGGLGDRGCKCTSTLGCHQRRYPGMGSRTHHHMQLGQPTVACNWNLYCRPSDLGQYLAVWLVSHHCLYYHPYLYSCWAVRWCSEGDHLHHSSSKTAGSGRSSALYMAHTVPDRRLPVGRYRCWRCHRLTRYCHHRCCHQLCHHTLPASRRNSEGGWLRHSSNRMTRPVRYIA